MHDKGQYRRRNSDEAAGAAGAKKPGYGIAIVSVCRSRQ
jgi:hypothetical protein